MVLALHVTYVLGAERGQALGIHAHVYQLALPLQTAKHLAILSWSLT